MHTFDNGHYGHNGKIAKGKTGRWKIDPTDKIDENNRARCTYIQF